MKSTIKFYISTAVILGHECDSDVITKLLRSFVLVLLLSIAVHPGYAQLQGSKGHGDADTIALPKPHATKSKMNFSKVQGWKNGRKPTAPNGFSVERFADGLQNPRTTYVTPNGDILVVESNTPHSWLEKIGAIFIGANKSNSMKNSADRITLLRDTNGDGIPEVRHTFLEGLNLPFGVLILNNWLFVANTDALYRFPYRAGDLKITGKGEKLIDLPAGKYNRHWTRNLIASKDGSKIYIAVGSGSNNGEHGLEAELLKASILEINPDGSGMRIYASGLRNPVGMGWAPGTKTLWTVVNERDLLGDDLVPDYLTSVKEGAFYGWPYSYFGKNKDVRVKDDRPSSSLDETVVPDVGLGSHTASLGLTFVDNDRFPAKYREGAIIAQHGSWNRSTLSGYKIMFVPFRNGKPSGPPEDFITGFMADIKKDKVYGRPVGVTLLPEGRGFLITDDVNNVIWRIGTQGNSVVKR
ncbi:MAG: sorbosone dehydrogenase family protein [Chryseolinea sp.]